ncbi:MAG TPA: hypothetical protein VKS82_23880 [Streptosporangiaceae bacterium]|jgi:hypothetical protein|nr:hypothetical protein [Streptosporangiaceae bacterium]
MTGNPARDEEPDLMGGPEPDEQASDVMGGADPDRHTDVMDKPRPGQNRSAE